MNNYYENYEYPYTSNNIYGAYEGYLKGNMFKNLYEQYKNYRPDTVRPTSEKEQDLFNLNQIGFAMHDLNLYLDIYNEDKQILNLFEHYKNLYNELLTQFENKYGPICVNSVKNQIPFEWESTTFPWEVK